MGPKQPGTIARPTDEASSKARNERGSILSAPSGALLAGCGDGYRQLITLRRVATSPASNRATDQPCPTAELAATVDEQTLLRALVIHLNLVQLGFLTSKEVFDRVMKTTSVHVTIPEALSSIAQEWGMDMTGQILPVKKLDRDQLARLYNHAGTVTRLAELLGVRRGTVNNHRKRLGIADLPREMQKRRPPTKKSRAAKE